MSVQSSGQKLNAKTVIRVLAMARKGLSCRKIASECGFSPETVSKLFREAEQAGCFGDAGVITDARGSTRWVCRVCRVEETRAAKDARIRRRFADGESMEEICQGEGIAYHHFTKAIGGKRSSSLIKSLRALKLLLDGESQSEIGRRFGMAHTTVQRIEADAIKAGILMPIDSAEHGRRVIAGGGGRPRKAGDA